MIVQSLEKIDGRTFSKLSDHLKHTSRYPGIVRCVQIISDDHYRFKKNFAGSALEILILTRIESAGIGIICIQPERRNTPGDFYFYDERFSQRASGRVFTQGGIDYTLCAKKTLF